MDACVWVTAYQNSIVFQKEESSADAETALYKQK